MDATTVSPANWQPQPGDMIRAVRAGRKSRGWFVVDKTVDADAFKVIGHDTYVAFYGHRRHSSTVKPVYMMFSIAEIRRVQVAS